MERIKKLCLIITLFFVVLSQSSYSLKEVNAYRIEPDYANATLNSYGTGTIADPWRIYYLKQLAEMVVFNTTDFHALANDNYILMNDLDFKDANADGVLNDPYVAPNSLGTGNWVPIGNAYFYRSFYGRLYGNNHSISNMKIDAPSQDYVGLFGQLYTSLIQDLHLINVDISGNLQTGGLAGYTFSGTIINNVSVSGTVNGKNSVGGIVGLHSTVSSIYNVVNSATVTGSGTGVGGIVGKVDGQSGTSNLINVYNLGNVIMTGNDSTYAAGGIIGLNTGSNNTTPTLLKNAYSTGSVTGVSLKGNLVGNNTNYLTLENTYYPSNSLSSIGNESVNTTFIDCEPYTTMAALLVDLNAWVSANQTNPFKYFPWRDGGTNPVFNKVVVPSAGNTSYVASASAVIIDSGLLVLASQLNKLVVKIDNVKTGDLLSYVDANGIVGSVYADGTIELTSSTLKTGAEFQTVARTVKFYSNGEAADRTISFTINNGTEDVSAYKTIQFTTYSVTYEGNGSTSGSVPTDSTKYSPNATVTVLGNTESLAKTGYSFAGWTKGASTYLANSTFAISANSTLLAKWSLVDYTITYHLNSGTNAIGAPTTFTIASSSITLPTPTKVNYDFSGWYDNESFTGSSITTISTGSSGNKEYYAKWATKSYSIEFDSNLGSTVDTITQDYDSVVSKPTDPTRDHYVFEGWYSDEALSVAYTFTKMPGENIILYASWSLAKYDVIFVDYDDTELSKQSIEYLLGAIAPDNPTRSGYQFTGWDKTYDVITEDIMITATYKEIIIDLKGDDNELNPKTEGLFEAITFTEEELDPTHTISVQLDMTIEDLTNLNEDEKTLITDYQNELLDDGVYTCLFIDINLFKTIDETQTKILETNSPITLTFTIPESLYNKSFSLIRIHTDTEGVSSLVEMEYTYNPITHEITFETDQFSVYGLVSATNKLPNTGNDVNSVGFLLMSLLVGLLVMRKKIKLS